MVETPELDRMMRLREDGVTPALGRFLDWLRDQDLRLMRYGDVIDDRICIVCRGQGVYLGRNRHPEAGWSTTQPVEIVTKCDPCGGEGYNQVVTGQDWFEDARSPEKLLADFTGINLDKVEDERRALLATQRELNRS